VSGPVEGPQRTDQPFETVLKRVDFDEAMKAGTPADASIFRHANGTRMFNLYKQMYESNIDAPFTDTPKIPKIVH
jgi:hypothetical protein